MSDPHSIARLGGSPPSPWEDVYGYSRVVAAGPFVLIGGTTSIDQCGFVMGESLYEQASEIFRKLGEELGRVNLSFQDVVQTRMFVTDISRADEVGRAHFEAFGSIRPVASMVEVTALIDPRMLVEIEVVAYRGAGL